MLEQTAVDPVATIGEMAHIVAHAKGPGAPRVDPTFPDHLRDKYDNLILLCDTHHKIVDVQPNTYTVGELRGWKNELEQYVTNQFVIEITNVTFVELEQVTKALMKSQVLAGETFQLTAPVEKMRKNGLSERSAILIRLGMANSHKVADFVAKFTATAPSFSDDLKAGFVAEYNAKLSEGFAGDAVPLNEFGTQFNFDDHVRIRLSDEDEKSSLTGIRFEVDTRKKSKELIDTED